MAVPFSKPSYPGGPPRRMGPPRRNRQNNQRHYKTPHQQYNPAPQHHTPFPGTSTPHHQPNQYYHPIANFLYGDGVIQLDRLNRVTRLAFFALYEAWRLLQDLSPNQNQPRSITTEGQTTQHHIIGSSSQNISSTTRLHSTNSRAPVQQSSPQKLTVVEVSNAERKNLPDVVIASTQSRNTSSQNSNNTNQPNINGEPRFEKHITPINKQSCGQVITCSPKEINFYNHNEIFTSPLMTNNSSLNNDSSNAENEEDFNIENNNHLRYRNRNNAEANHLHLEKNRKFMDDQNIRLRNAENARKSRLRRSSFSESSLPDLIPISERDQSRFEPYQLLDCDYGGVQPRFDDDIDHMIDQIDFSSFCSKNGYTSAPWERGKCFKDLYDDEDDDYEDDDMVSDDKKLLSSIVSQPTTTIATYQNNEDYPWSNSGMLLIEIASAFEMSYGVTFENDQERQQYELYRRMKADVMRSQARNFYGNNEENVFGVNLFELGKAVLSQALLTGMWYMLKRIKIV